MWVLEIETKFCYTIVPVEKKKKRILGDMYSFSLKTSQTPRIYLGGSNLPGNWIEV